MSPRAQLRMTQCVVILAAGAFLIISGHRLAAADIPDDILLWPADHPANAGDARPANDWEDWSTNVANQPAITPFLPAAEKRTGAACVICPGGGYGGLSMKKEGLEPARWFQERGVAAFVLRYRCGGGKNQHPVPMQDVQRAIRIVRSRAGEWHIDVKQIGVLGFSAGGHLAATAATHFDAGDPDAKEAIDRQSCRPDFQVLIYPVISMRTGITHNGSLQNLLGDSPPEELVTLMSNELQVTAETPPAFIVHSGDDDAVPVFNSLLYYSALFDKKVPAELHVFERGGHGYGMLRTAAANEHWPEQLEPWMKLHGWIK